ncbi:endo-1,3-alpha-glucanase family glycosylhydrolase [Defluviicoccus vanus]|uniref:Glycoside hydrolase family 71 protein n=1 Tax=Defluviicoccus vanus TaxID=111831 RepID=A0A7H1N127_9PROT|nr:endo-1,3-alpha-glucanase family glycosylhydrolase [Defluviicoccus vanus]QNT69413.1 hypothetical protein HQ394_08875 [Defluviicoccus vanus]
MDNKPAANDLFTVNEMSPYGHNGKYYGAGGRMRQRPLPRPVSSDPQWKIRDMEDEVDRASAIGLDCFFLSLCTISNGTVCWDELRDMLVAARNRNNGFKVVPMMDVASLRNANRTSAQVAAAIASVATSPALMRDKAGRIYIGATNGDLAPPSWWQGIKSGLASRGINVSFMLTLQSYAKSKDKYMSLADGLGSMGAGTPMSITDVSGRVQELHNKGNIYLNGIRPQDFRPKAFWFLESNNSELFRKALTSAITSGSDWLIFNSWNDREETTEFSPSTGTQWAFYDLAAYYLTWFKTRQQPQIVRDVLYYFHRVMWTSTPYNHNKQTRAFYEHESESKQPLANNIELVGFLKNPGTLQISIGGKTYSQDAGKGITSFRAPLAGTTHLPLAA